MFTVAVPLPEVSGEVVDDGTLGRLLVTSVLRGALDDDELDDAVDGWGGDNAVAWRDGDRSCVTASLVGDTPDDTAELQQAFTDWSAERDAASVEPGAGPDDPFTVEACA